MAAEGPCDLPVPDLRTMEELCQPSLNGRGVPIALIVIQATNFGLKNDMIQQVQNSCQFHGLPGDDANKHLDKFLHVTQSIKMNGVTDDILCLYLFPHSLTHHATACHTLKTYMLQEPIKFMKMKTASSSGSGTLPGNTITNPKEDLNGITTQSENAYQGPTIPTTYSSPVVEHKTEATKDKVHSTDNESTKDIQPPVIPTESPILTSKPVNSPIIEPVASRVSAPSFADALILMPKFSPSIKSLLTNKDKLCDLARTLLNEHCSAALLKKLPEKLGDPGNSLPDLSPTCMTLELADRSISYPVGVVEDVFVKVANRINVIDMACEEYSQEVLGFSDVIASGNLTPYYDSIVSTTSTALTLFGNSDFLLQEVDAFLALEDDPTSPEVDQSYVDIEGDILLLEAFLNDDPSLPPPNHGNYLLEVRKELKIYEAKSNKSSIDEPLEVKRKDLPPYLEYAFLEGGDKLPVIIAKDLKDFEPAVQHQRRVNPKIHDVIKQEVLKLLDAGLIYPIFDSPWVSPVHCVPKKGGFTVVENEENELILTRLVKGWRVCIDYRKLNEATRKDHFPLPFMDQMLERLAGNQYYCFLDGFYGNSFQTCLSHLEKMLKRCEDTNLCLNWEKSHFMVKEGIVLGHKISKEEIEVDKAKVITKLPHPITVKEGIVLGHKISKEEIEVDKAKVITKLPHPITVKDALILMPKFGPTIKSLLTNKEKLFELARTPLNKHCSAVLLKKLPEKLGDPSKFLIPCNFSRMDGCLALADHSASINLMPLSMWKMFSLPELSPMCMTLELEDRLISHPVGVTEDVFVTVRKFHFLADFVVIDFDVDPRVPLILERSFLKTERALIDVYEIELTLRVSNKAITFNLDQTSRYSANYDAESIQIDVIDVACEEYTQEVLGFFMKFRFRINSKKTQSFLLVVLDLIQDSLSTQVVSAAKLPILNPNEFDLWKMRLEQYFLMTDYSLWEVILNGDSLVPTIVVEGVIQPVGHTSVEQKLARRNELKARGTLLMALPTNIS
nr:hypothetical protein [Tanacetum cinerariifolium]